MIEDGAVEGRRTPVQRVGPLGIVVVAAVLLGLWGRLSVQDAGTWFANSWIPYVLGSWLVVRQERRWQQAFGLAFLTVLLTLCGVEIGHGIRAGDIDLLASLSGSLLLGAAVIGAGAALHAEALRRAGTLAAALASAVLASAVAALAVAILVQDRDVPATVFMLACALVIVVLSRKSLAAHRWFALAAVVLTLSLTLLAYGLPASWTGNARQPIS